MGSTASDVENEQVECIPTMTVRFVMVGLILAFPLLMLCMYLYAVIFVAEASIGRSFPFFMMGLGIGWIVISAYQHLLSVDWLRTRYVVNDVGIVEYRRNGLIREGRWKDLQKAVFTIRSANFQFENGLEIYIWDGGLGAYRPVVQAALKRCRDAGLEDKIVKKPL